MRYIIFCISIIIILGGCKNNSVAPTNGQILSTSAVLDNIQYSFAIPKAEYGIHDTLNATLTAYNQSSSTDTIYTSYSPYFYSWSLRNAGGKIIMYGPVGADNLIRIITLNPNQSTVMYSLHQAIADTSGATVVAGSYVLQWNLNNRATTLLTFSLDLSLQ